MKEAKQYPFQLIGYPEGEGLTHVNLEITKSFIEIDKKMYVDKIDFNYECDYPSNIALDSTQHITSNAILYAYDYKGRFDLPRFNFTDSQWIDYVQIFTIPPNELFWSHLAEFSLNDADNSNEKFHQSYGYDLNKSWFNEHPGMFTLDKAFYKEWSRKRIILKESESEPKVNYVSQNIPPSRLYHLEAQILLDVNEYGDSISATTKTMIDPYRSYFHFPIDNMACAFINMYYDIVEIERMELAAEIDELGKDKETIYALYEKRMAHLNQISENYFSEVNRGENKKAFIKWDDIVYEKLKISNINTFDLYAE